MPFDKDVLDGLISADLSFFGKKSPAYLFALFFGPSESSDSSWLPFFVWMCLLLTMSQLVFGM